MSKKNKAEMKKANDQIANVPNPPVPNRARTEMKSGDGDCDKGACEIKHCSKKNH